MEISILKSKFFRGIKNASYLAIGNFITQLISFFGIVYIARLLGPQDYGIYVTVMAFVGLFEILILKGLNRAIIREGSKDVSSMHLILEKTIGIRNLLILIAIIICIIASLFTPYDLQVKLYIILFSLHLFYTGLREFIGTIYQATEKMQYISIFQIINRVLFISLSIAFLHMGYGVLALFIIFLFSNLVTISINYKYSQRFVKFNFFSKVQIDKKLLSPALTFSLLIFIGFFAGRVDLLMISFLGTSRDVGIYAVAYRIARQGIMIRNVTGTAFFPMIVRRFQERALKGSLLIKYSLLFVAGIFVITLVASIFAERFVLLLLGSEFKYSGEILRILIFYLCFEWATLPFMIAAQATHNEKYLIAPRLVMAGLNIPLNYILFLRFGVIGIAYSTLIVTLIGCISVCYISYRVMRKQKHLI